MHGASLGRSGAGRLTVPDAPSSTSGSSSEPAGEELLDAPLAPDLAVGAGDMPAAWCVSQVSGPALAPGTLLLAMAGPRPVHGNREGGGWGFVRLLSGYVVVSVVGSLLAMLLGTTVRGPCDPR